MPNILDFYTLDELQSEILNRKNSPDSIDRILWLNQYTSEDLQNEIERRKKIKVK